LLSASSSRLCCKGLKERTRFQARLISSFGDRIPFTFVEITWKRKSLQQENNVFHGKKSRRADLEDELLFYSLDMMPLVL
jgi:hypothetical protein